MTRRRILLRPSLPSARGRTGKKLNPSAAANGIRASGRRALSRPQKFITAKWPQWISLSVASRLENTNRRSLLLATRAPRELSDALCPRQDTFGTNTPVSVTTLCYLKNTVGTFGDARSIFICRSVGTRACKYPVIWTEVKHSSTLLSRRVSRFRRKKMRNKFLLIFFIRMQKMQKESFRRRLK